MKYKKWKNYLKGVYDQHSQKHSILVTGSARLDLFRKAGDSLQGRYHFLRLYPLSAKELAIETQKDLISLYELGGFPEPFFKGIKLKADRWSSEYQSRIINDDIRDMEKVADLSALEQLLWRLPECVGGPLSINALREDLNYNFKTVARWLDLLEKYYSIFRISAFGSPRIKAVKKEQKHYHYDWNFIDDEGARFECMMAVHLQKYAHFLADTEGRKIELRFNKDVEAREVDFILTEKNKPLMAIECKLGDSEISKSLQYFKMKFPEVDCFQVHLKGKKDYLSKDSIRVLSALTFLKKFI